MGIPQMHRDGPGTQVAGAGAFSWQIPAGNAGGSRGGALEAKASPWAIWFRGLSDCLKLNLNAFWHFCLTPHHFLFIETQPEVFMSGPLGN